MTHQATGAPSAARLRENPERRARASPAVPPVILRSVASTVSTSVKMKVVIAK